MYLVAIVISSYTNILGFTVYITMRISYIFSKDLQFFMSFACQTYSDGKLLKSHIQSVHENCQDFLCKPCGKRFGSYRKLESHNWQSHSQVTCDVCGKEVANKVRLRKHKVFVHNETNGVLFCEKCPKDAFFSQRTFEKHMSNKH